MKKRDPRSTESAKHQYASVLGGHPKGYGAHGFYLYGSPSAQIICCF